MNAGWMVNFPMRRVERVEPHPNRSLGDYAGSAWGLYKGPRRDYKLHASQVYRSERDALMELERRMAGRYRELSAKLEKYGSEMLSVREQLRALAP